ncbi:MAG: FAD-dependent oxidoreductase [bacterium]
MSKPYVIARVGDLRDGEMKEVEVAEGRKVLLVVIDGEYRVLGATCPHYGAPLAQGLLYEGRIRCPWHHSVFDAGSGGLREPPALDGLPRFEVRIDGDRIVAVLPDEMPASCHAPMAAPDPAADPRTFVIVGSGAAGLAAAETLRQDGYRGRVVMLTGEDHLPYDRTDLSKPYLRNADARKPYLRCAEFYGKYGIEVLTGHHVEAVDPAGKTVLCRGGARIAWDRLLLATGAAPRRLGAPGEDLENVLYLRSLDDCERIRGLASAGSGRAVLVGASFIAMEVAAALVVRGFSVTIAAPEPVPFEATLGKEIGGMYRSAHEQKGVSFRLGARVDRFEGAGGRVAEVVLADGERLAAGLVVIGIGVRPVTGYLKGFDKHEDGSLLVDRQFRVSGDVFAAGDIARFPDWRTGEPIRIEHWRVAEQHGRAAAHNMAGRNAGYSDVPFFWTNQHYVITSYVGYARGWDEIVLDGDLEERRFLAFYLKGGRVLAAAGCEEARKMCLMAEILKDPDPPPLDLVRRKLADLR